MPKQADTNRVSLRLSEEAVWGETPGAGALAPRGYELRTTGESIMHDKTTVTSNTIRADRQRDSVCEVGVASNGDINFETAFRDYELLLQGALLGTYTDLISRTQTSGQLAAALANNRFTGPIGTGANVVTGADAWVTGFSANLKNNGRFKIAASASTTIDINPVDAGADLANETSSAATSIRTAKGVFTDIAATATGLTSTTTIFTTSVALAVGQWIRVAGFVNAANNGIRKISAIAANTLTFADFTTGIIEAAGPSVQLTARRLTNGTAQKFFRLEKIFQDLTNVVHAAPGLEVNQLQLKLESQQLITGSFSLMGKEILTDTATKLSSVTPVSATQPINATANVGALTEGGVSLVTAVKSLDLTVNNNLRSRTAVASRAPISQGTGFVDVTGTLTAYFEDNALYNKFLAHTGSSISFRLTDAAGNVIVVTIPNVYYTKGQANASGGNDDVMLPLEFTAVRDATTGVTIIFDILAV